MAASTILLVDDDEVLSQVLRRVLTRQGHMVVEAGNVTQALDLARDRHPQLGLLDLCLPDGDGVELARRLREQETSFPLILMTAYPLRLRDYPELAQGFTHVLTKPLNLEELRQAIDSALLLSAGPPASASPVDPSTPSREEARGTWEKDAPDTGPPARQKPLAPTLQEPAMTPVSPVASPEASPSGRGLSIALTLGALLVVTAGVLLALPALGVSGVPDLLGQLKSHLQTPPETGDETPVTLVDARTGTFELPEEVVQGLGLQGQVIPEKAQGRPLELSGSLAFNPDTLGRIQSRFPGEVVELGKNHEPSYDPSGSGRTETERPLRYGDRVHQGDLMAVVWSKDLGTAKSDLVDALVQLDLDQETLKGLEQLFREGNAPEATVRLARNKVSSDLNAVSKAERVLRTWRVSPEEIDAVRAEAQRVIQRKGVHDQVKERDWARVEVRAPFDGVVVEKNVTLGNIVDTTFDLYKIARLDQLAVYVNAYEEDLRALQDLQAQAVREQRLIPWQVRVPAYPNAEPLESNGIERISAVIDPTQHTALVMGLVKNRVREHRGDQVVTTTNPPPLYAGQFATALIELPAPPNVVSVPSSALDETGSESILFVWPDPSRPRFTLKRVVVDRRFGKTVYVRSKLTPEQERQGLEPVHPGERVVTQAAVELKAALEEVQTKARAQSAQP